MRILYVTTSFPVYSETFLQREVRALRKAGAEIEIWSLHRGESEFDGLPVRKFNKWSLLKLFYLLPFLGLRKSAVLLPITRELNARRPPSLLNLFENLLALGAAIVVEKRVRDFGPDVIHCVWAGGPAAFGWLCSSLLEVPFSTGAHAYDLFEHGGDWLLEPKLQMAALVHVSTSVAEKRVRSLCEAEKVCLIRRGLNTLPAVHEPRRVCAPLRIICVARLVEKKGLFFQLEIYRRLKAAGIAFQAEWVGEGPLEERIREEIARFDLGGEVTLLGRLSEGEALERIEAADLLFHTGIVAASGDRDGLPNVVPEAMASGTIVVGSPVSGVVEAIEDGVTGFLRAPWQADSWVELCVELQRGFELRCRIATAARHWVEESFMADRNSGRLLGLLSRLPNQYGEKASVLANETRSCERCPTI